MKIFLATWLQEDNQGETLTKCGYEDRLVSFYFLQDESDERLLEYFATGQNVEHPRTSKKTKE